MIDTTKRITDMSAFLRDQPTTITEYDEPLGRRLIEKITVYEYKFADKFKSGVRWILMNNDKMNKALYELSVGCLVFLCA